MGTFRLILALCVVVAHASPLPGFRTLEPQLAVRTFFVISGFYMALILAEKYPHTAQGRNLFYTNRLLRIYPMYLLTLLAAVLFYAVASVHLGHPVDRLELWRRAWAGGHRGALGLVAASQFSVIGLDVTPLLCFDAGGGFRALTDALSPGSVYAWRFNFLPHCWSIGAELLFYAAAPALVSLRKPVQAALTVTGLLGVTWIAHRGGFLGSTAAYHLGILQFPYFLLGIVAHSCLGQVKLFQPSALRAALPALLLAALTLSGLPQFGKATGYGYVLLSWLLIPMLFHVSRHWRWDRWIGEFSYPIYLLHVPMKWVLLAARGVETKDAAEVSGWALVLATLVGAGLMVLLVDRPLERFRRSRFEQRARPSPDIDAVPAKS